MTKEDYINLLENDRKLLETAAALAVEENQDIDSTSLHEILLESEEITDKDVPNYETMIEEHEVSSQILDKNEMTQLLEGNSAEKLEPVVVEVSPEELFADSTAEKNDIATPATTLQNSKSSSTKSTTKYVYINKHADFHIKTGPKRAVKPTVRPISLQPQPVDPSRSTTKYVYHNKHGDYHPKSGKVGVPHLNIEKDLLPSRVVKKVDDITKNLVRNQEMANSETEKPTPFDDTPPEIEPTPAFKTLDNSCETMLNTGSWLNFTTQAKSSNAWNFSGTFGPSTCQIKKYSTEELQKCFLSNPVDFSRNRMVQIIGDSRSRLIYRVLSARLHGLDTIEDVKVHDDLANAPFMYYWSQSFNGEPVGDRHEMSSFRRLLKEGSIGTYKAAPPNR